MKQLYFKIMQFGDDIFSQESALYKSLFECCSIQSLYGREIIKSLEPNERIEFVYLDHYYLCRSFQLQNDTAQIYQLNRKSKMSISLVMIANF